MRKMSLKPGLPRIPLLFAAQSLHISPNEQSHIFCEIRLGASVAASLFSSAVLARSCERLPEARLPMCFHGLQVQTHTAVSRNISLKHFACLWQNGV